MEKNEAFVLISTNNVAKVRLASGEIQVVPRFGMSTLWMDRENETATLTYQDGTTYEGLQPLTFKEAFSWEDHGMTTPHQLRPPPRDSTGDV